ncbi:MAG: FAD-dependent oxidoreductase [Oscillospiraceae bacterium]|jgi:NADPH-dependent 2,4-dienoyl-CoA reductase/sulfur reductase-like enzyme|nr:FAD-dependent oxidoreductase [Oscillospiraceae bacterium]
MYDVIVVGGGPAGLAAACAARRQGAARVLVAERDGELGGILNQCIHSGFGLHYFQEELTGPEYARRFIEKLRESGADVMTDTMVTAVTRDLRVSVLSPRDGVQTLSAGAVVLTMGCRERTRGAIAIPGARPAGVLTAGAAQKYINVEGYAVGRRVIILGSGDIGLIMARRLTLEGARVLACVEAQPQPGGLARNIAQCLRDYDIPLYLSHTITDIRGRRRVEGVTVSRVDAHMRPIPGGEMDFACDTVLLSVGLIPENELTQAAGIPMDERTRGAWVYEDMQTGAPGIFAAGNALHVHDFVDFVTEESTRAGEAAARYAAGERPPDGRQITVCAGDGVAYTVPQRVRPDNVPRAADVFFRVRRPLRDARIQICVAGEAAHTHRRARVAPAEMERVPVPRATLQRAAAIGELTIRVEGEEAHG